MISFPYILLSLFVFCLHFYSAKSKLNLQESRFQIIIVFIVFFCFRGFIFTDVFSYKPFFEEVVPPITEIFTNNFLKYTWWEPGFVIYCSLIKTFTSNYLIFQIIDSLIDIILLRNAFKYFEADEPLNYLIFLVMDGMTAFFNTYRNIKAILLFFNSLRFVVEKKWVHYYLIASLAFVFHSSSIFYFVCYPILVRVKLTQKKMLAYMATGLILGLFMKTILSLLISIAGSFLPVFMTNRLNSYVLSNSSMSVSRFLSFGVIEKFLVATLIISSFNRYNTDKEKIILKVYLLYFLSYFSFFSFMVLSQRVSSLFVVSYWILIPKYYISRAIKYKMFVAICLLAYCVLKMSLYRQSIQKYDNFLFFSPSTYEERYEIFRNWN